MYLFHLHMTLILKGTNVSHQANHRPVPKTPISTQGCYLLEAFNPPPVKVDSAAMLVMTDLSRVPPATISSDASLEDANHSMLVRGVRLLLVVGQNNGIVGLVTTVDVHGEKAVLVAQRRQAKRSELRVSDVMVPVDKMDAMNIEDVKKALVGNVVASLKSEGRVHAIVVGRGQDGRQSLLGIFSASQIARQLGVQIHTHERAQTFAEIERIVHTYTTPHLGGA